MSDAPIIGSGKPHTVSLSEGSTVASHARARTAGAPLPEELPETVRMAQAPDPLHLEKPRMRLRPAKSKLPTAGAIRAGKASQAPLNAVDAALLARITDLERRNSQVRVQLDSTVVDDPLTRSSP